MPLAGKAYSYAISARNDTAIDSVDPIVQRHSRSGASVISGI